MTRRTTINGRFVTDIDRDLAALELRRQGHTYDQIARLNGYASRSSAYGAVQRALALSVRETADEVRQLEIDRLEDLRRPALEALRRRHLVVSQGKVMHDPDTGDPLIDDMPLLHAIDRLIKISERMAAYRGLDAPRRSVSEVLTLDVIQAEILRLKSQVSPEQLAAIERGAANGTTIEGARDADSG
jgi:hypothetical protein